jgi:hypothetical protein
MNRHQIICGSLAWACVAGTIAILAGARPGIEPPHLFFAGLTLMLAFLFVWMGWWDDAVNDNDAPSWIERTAAGIWLWTRRILCWSAALVFWGFAATMLVEGVELQHVPIFLAVVAFGAMAIWVGLKGGGHSQNMGDDAAVHAERRKRYGWWF